MSEVSLSNLAAGYGTMRDFVSPESFLRENPFIRDAGNPLLSVLDDPDLDQLAKYTPIVLTGPAGIGKSTVARNLIAGLWLNHGLKESDVFVISGADFYRSHAAAIETKSTVDWHERFSNAQVFLIDGVQQLSNKVQAQLELRLIVDEFLDAGKLLICTALEPIDHLVRFDSSLTSRLNGGLSIPLTLPDTNARLEYLSQLCREVNVSFMPGAAQLLAENVNGVLPLLKNALLQIQSMIRESNDGTNPKTSSRKISVEAVKQYLLSATRKEPELRSIAAASAKHFSVKLADLKGPSRKQSIVRARAVTVYLARILSNASLESIGSFLGDRDHTTVLHSFRKIEKLLADDQQLQSSVAELKAALEL